MSSDCFGLLLKLSVYLFYSFFVSSGEYLRNSKQKSTSARVSCQAEGLSFSRGVSPWCLFLKCNQIVTMSAKRFSFLFVFFFSILFRFSIIHHKHFFWQHWLTLNVRFFILFHEMWDIGFCFSFSREQHDFLLMSRWFSPYI